MLKKATKSKTELALEKLGLGENEASLYTLMLKYPKITVQELQRHSRFPRTMLYYILNNLIRLGLVSAVENQRRTAFVTHSPERLYDLLDEKQKEFEAHKESIKEVIPELKNQYRLSQQRPGVRILEGIEGYRGLMNDMLEGQPNCIFSYLSDSDKGNPGLEIREGFELQRASQKIKQHVLIHQPTPLKHLAKNSHNSYTEIRVCPESMNQFEAEVYMYSWKVAYVRYEQHQPIVMIIEDPKFYEMQKNIFTYIWDKAIQKN